MYWNDLHKIFKRRTHMGGYERSKDVAIVTDFCANQRKMAYSTFILCPGSS